MADHQNNTNNNQRDGFVLPRSDHGPKPGVRANDAAADLIRQKLDKIYGVEPDAQREEQEAEAVKHRSKHQQFMYNLNHSGKTVVEVQTAWHEYYMALADDEKQQVWQEFYANNQLAKQAKPQLPADTPTETEKLASVRNEIAGQANRPRVSHAPQDTRPVEDIQQAIRQHVPMTRRQKARQHAHSLLFGLSMGALVVFIFLFGFFNEAFIAPFVQPSRKASATPLIVNADTVAATDEPQVIIPKINVQIPVNFDQKSTDEAAIENDLESGVVHYPTTSVPGQNGNAAFFGHSSNNIFNKGKYKFAFVLLHELVPGDTFYLTKDKKVYAYKVFNKTVVDPSEVGVLNPVAGHQATATLITCDPPGTSLRRLVIVGDQISPAVSSNTAAATATPATAGTNAVIDQIPDRLAGNGQTLLSRFIGSTAGKTMLIVIGVVVLLVFFRFVNPNRRSSRL